ncbi:MAG TPA: hypothetical protein VMV15_01505 [Candidatus Binataceae bacterium]|nr:hypothetical protein [Candidatus Binataceae bacterium]
MKAGKRIILTGIFIYPLAFLMCLMLVRGAHGPIGDDGGLMMALYLIVTFPLVIIVAGMVLLHRNR